MLLRLLPTIHLVFHRPKMSDTIPAIGAVEMFDVLP